MAINDRSLVVSSKMDKELFKGMSFKSNEGDWLKTDNRYERCFVKWLSCVNSRCWRRVIIIAGSFVLKISVFTRWAIIDTF